MDGNAVIFVIIGLVLIGIVIAFVKSSNKTSSTENSTSGKLKINMYEEPVGNESSAQKVIVSLNSESKKTVQGKWTCPVCETMNDHSNSECIVCGSPKAN